MAMRYPVPNISNSLSLSLVLSCVDELGSFKMQAGKGGELTRDETTIIGGALELTEKVARDAMTPISETFAIDINANLDRFNTNLIITFTTERHTFFFSPPS